MAVYIEHDAGKHQFIAMIEGKPSTLSYRIIPGEKILDYYSTFVPPELRGRNIGQELVQFALEYAIENGYSVIPSCPFVQLYIDRHPDYQKVIKNKPSKGIWNF